MDPATSSTSKNEMLFPGVGQNMGEGTANKNEWKG